MNKKILSITIAAAFHAFCLSQPANDNCANATQLTLGNQLCSQNSSGVTLQANECYISVAGSTQGSMWYYFNATTSTVVLSFLQTNVTNCVPYYIVWGPYSSVSAGCSNILSNSIPCSSAGGTVLSSATPTQYVTGPIGGMYCNILNGDPGNYISLNGLNTTSGNNTYLIQIVNNSCGGKYDKFAQFCIGTYSPAANSVPTGASVINSCGTQYSGNTSGGYAPAQNSSPSLGNIDGNNSTTCPTSFGGNCGSNGNDVPFVINNPSYFTFCASANGTYNINFDVISCTQPQSGAQGAQMALLIGSSSSMTLQQVAPNPMLPSSPVWTSSNFSLAAGQCAYLVVDGFAGDQCTYTYTLNNVAGGCLLLPIELLRFTAQGEKEKNIIAWVTATEKNNDYFTLEKSGDGIHFEVLEKIDGAGNSTALRNYEVTDLTPFSTTYYRLSQTDYDGETRQLGIISVDNKSILKEKMYLYPNPSGDNTALYVYTNEISTIDISINDYTGKNIQNLSFPVKKGENVFELPSFSKQGIYFISVQKNAQKQIFKFVKE